MTTLEGLVALAKFLSIKDEYQELVRLEIISEEEMNNLLGEELSSSEDFNDDIFLPEEGVLELPIFE